MAREHDSLRSRLESEQKTLTGELEQLRVSSLATDERREGSPFGKRRSSTLCSAKPNIADSIIRSPVLGRKPSNTPTSPANRITSTPNMAITIPSACARLIRSDSSR